MDCPGCNKPLIDGQAMNGLLKCHWDCQEATRAKLGNDTALSSARERVAARMLQDGITPSHPIWGKLMSELEKDFK